MQVSIQLTQDQTARLAALKDSEKRLLQPLAQAWGSGSLEILGRAVKGRFSDRGPFPVSQNRLGVVTNRLRKSLRATAVQVNSGTGAISVAMGSNVSYLAGHEFGFKGRVNVRGFTRKAVAAERTKSGQVRRGKLSKGHIHDLKVSKLVRGRLNYSLVRPHSRRVNIPARRPLGTEIESLQSRLTMYSKLKAVITRYLGISS